MHARSVRSPIAAAALALLVAATTSCGGEAAKYDWRNRVIDWKYGPTTGGATAAHLQATGTKGEALAQGWNLRIRDGNQLTVAPYQLAGEHARFGKVRMAVGLFDKDGKPVETVVSEPITKDQATFAFELSEETVQKTHDAILWFRDA